MKNYQAMLISRIGMQNEKIFRLACLLASFCACRDFSAIPVLKPHRFSPVLKTHINHAKSTQYVRFFRTRRRFQGIARFLQFFIYIFVNDLIGSKNALKLKNIFSFVSWPRKVLLFSYKHITSSFLCLVART